VDVRLRQALVDDADPLARLYAREREFLTPFEPDRPPAFFTPAGQREALRITETMRATGAGERWLILADGELVGVVALANVSRGAFQNATLGYWVAQAHNGRGVATRAVGIATRLAFGTLGLHRVEASTLVDNVGSRRVLARNGFRLCGLSPRYLHIGGAWRDHVHLARTAEDAGAPVEGVEEQLAELLRLMGPRDHAAAAASGRSARRSP
jgi:ribosomal-protein-alanine N-acetyltransferase